MARLPRIADLKDQDAGWGFYLCARKDRRQGRTGLDLLDLLLQDVSGQIAAKVLNNVDALSSEFDAGEFVKVQGRANLHHGRLEIVVEKIRRAHVSMDAADGFREEDVVPVAPRPVDEMWRELEERIASVGDPAIRQLLTTIVTQHADRLRIWPAARQVHHAYRSGLLEHVLAIMEVVVFLADRYGARKDLLIAGALLHDIGKLVELSYDLTTEYTAEGNLVGHIAIGARMVHEAAKAIPGLRPETLMEIEHLILSHHGALDLGSPVKPMTLEAFILAAADDLDARLHQVRRLLAGDTGESPFTAYNRHLERALYKALRQAQDQAPMAGEGPPRQAWAAWIAVCIIWGTTYLAIKVALETIPPFLMGGMRYLLAGAVLAAFVRARGGVLPDRRSWPRIALMGSFMIGLGNGGVVWGAQFLTSGLTAVLIATSPFWMVSVDAMVTPGQQFHWRHWAGLGVGFGGIVLLVWPDITGGAMSRNFMWGVVAVQIACAGWAVGSALARRDVPPADVMGAAALQMIFGGLLMLAVATWLREWSGLHWSTRTSVAFAYLTVAGSVVAFTAYAYALRHLDVAIVSLYTYINPIIAVALGAMILGEPVGWRMIAAAAVIVAGVVIVGPTRKT